MRILLVEDNPDHRELMRLALTEYDATWRVEGVVSGEEVLRRLAEGDAYDLVFLDYSLPERDGLEVLEEIRRGEASPPVVMVTGRGDEQVAVEAIKRGAYDYIVKQEGYLQRLPVVARLAVEANRMALGHRAAEEALKKSEERFRTSVETLLEGFAILSAVRDRHGQLIDFKHEYINEAGCKMDQKSHEEHMGKTLLELLPTHKKIGLFDEYVRVVETGRPLTKEFLIYEDIYASGKRLKQAFDVQITRLEDGLVTTWQDITDKKKGEASLRESEERLKRLVEGSKDVIVMADLEGRVLYYNGPQEYGARSEDVLGKTPFDVFEPVIAARLMNQVKRVMKGGEVLTFEDNITWRGESFWFSIQMYPIKDEQGRMVAAGGIARNITERKRAEEALRESEARFSTIFHASPAAIAITRLKDSQLIDVNDAWQEVTGFTREEAIGRTPIELNSWVNPGDRDRLIGKLHDQGTVRDLEFQVRHKSGSVSDMLMSAELIELAGEQCVLTVAQDITERKRAEETIRRTTNTLQSLIQALPLATIALDRSGNVTLWNPSAERTFGWGESEVLGKPLMIVPEDEQDQYQALLGDEWKGNAAVGLEVKRQRKDGSLIDVRLSTALLDDGKGQITGSIGLLEDITERKQIEESLEKSQATYKELVENLNDIIFTVSNDGLIIYMSPIIKEIFGYSPTEVIGHSISEFVYHEDLELVMKRFGDVLQNHLYPSEYRVFKKTGEICWVRTSSRPMCESGRIIGIQGLMTDITERKGAEEALRVSLEKYRVLFESFPLGITISDKSGKVIEGNRQSERLLGITHEAHAQRRIDSKEWQIIRKDGTPMPVDEYASTRALRENRLIENVEMGIVKDKGEITWISVTAAPIPLEGYGVAIAYGDIAERKQAEEALLESENRYRSIFENTGTATFLNEEDGTFTMVNQEFERLSGYSKEELENKKKWAGFVEAGDLERMEGYTRLRKTDPSAAPKSYEFRFIDRWGNSRDILATADRVPGTTKNVASFQDITERKRGEEALRRAEENFRRSLDESPLGVRIVTTEGETVYANRATLEIYGYDSIEELRTTPVKKRYTPESYAEFRIRRDKRQQGENTPSEYEISILRENGEVRHLQVFRKEILWSDERQFQVVYQDITERKRAEEALRLSEERYRTLFDNVPVGLYRTTREGRFVDVNPALLELHGYTDRDTLLGMDARDVYVDPAVRGRWQETLERKGVLRNFEKQLRRQNGEVMWVEENSQIVRGPDGSVTYYEGSIMDITERKRTEDHLRSSTEYLRTLAAHLQSIREEERTMMAREIHDELGQALTGLKMDLSWLTKRLPKDKKPLFEKTESMIKLVDTTIQSVRRISSELRPGILDDLGLIAAIEWQAQDFEKRTGVHSQFFSHLEEVNLDRDCSTAVFRIFQETLTNVARHAKATDVKISLMQENDSLILKVEDNGRGITEEEAFNPKSLGLLGMRERAFVFGGEVKIHGRPGQGTTVTLKIPLKK